MERGTLGSQAWLTCALLHSSPEPHLNVTDSHVVLVSLQRQVTLLAVHKADEGLTISATLGVEAEGYTTPVEPVLLVLSG